MTEKKRSGGDLSRGDYLGLTLLVTVALIGTAVFLAYLLERRGIVSPNTILADQGGDPGAIDVDYTLGGDDGAAPGTSP